MRMRVMLTALIVACAGVAGGMGAAATPMEAAPVRADGCVLGPRYEVGRTLTYRMTTLTEVYPPAQAEGEKAVARVFGVDVTLRLTTLGIGEKGGASFVGVFERVKVWTVIDGNETTAEVTGAQAEATNIPSPAAEPVRAVAIAIGKAAMRLDVRADGTVSEATGLEQANSIAQQAGTDGMRIIGPLSAPGLARTMATMFRIDAPGEGGKFAERNAGDAWELKDRVSMGIADLVGTTSVKLDSCVDGIATLAATVHTTVEPPGSEGKEPGANPAAPMVQIDEQSDAVTMVWDATAGALKKRTRDGSMTLSARLGERTQVIQRIKSRGGVELVEAAKP